MARLETEGSWLVLRLSWLERLGAFSGEPRVALSTVSTVRVSTEPWHELRGIRAPGTGIPGVIALGTRVGRGGKDFCAVYGKGPAVVVELAAAAYGRLVVSSDDAVATAARLTASVGQA
jgi:hypothetical protein